MLAEIEEEPDTATVAIGVDTAFQLLADQALQFAEIRDGENEGRPRLLFGIGGGEHVVRAAIALGNGRHAVVLTQGSGFGAADLLEASSAQFNGVVVGVGSGL